MSPAIPIHLMDELQETMKVYQGRISAFFDKLKDRTSKAWDFIDSIRIHDQERVRFTARYPNTADEFVDIPYMGNMALRCTINLKNLPFNSIEIKLIFPDVIFGEKNVLPQLMFSVDSPVAYPGNIGLVWDGLMGKSIQPKFHPFTDPSKMVEDLITFYNDGTVDMFCDILNRGEYPQAAELRNFIQKLNDGEYKYIFSYQKNYLLEPNIIQVPIIGIHIPSEQKTRSTFLGWTYGKDWINPADIIMSVFYPICSIITMFDSNADYIQGSVPFKAQREKKDKRFLSQKEKVQERKAKDDFDPFKQKGESILRDEFGYAIEGKDGLGVRDVRAARKSLWQIERELAEKKEAAAAQYHSTDHVVRYPSAKIFFEENQGKKYKIEGDPVHLSFVDKGNVELAKLVQGALRYARDQIRIKRAVTSDKAIEILFSVYNLGFMFF